MRKVISLRKKTRTEREEEDSILTVYLHALGMLDDGSAQQPSQCWTRRSSRVGEGVRALDQ